jgi:hypothetical protein
MPEYLHDINTILSHGQYLGHCSIKGNIYSVPDKTDNNKYYIVAVNDNEVTILFQFEVNNK